MVFVVPHHTHRAASRPHSLHQTDRLFSSSPSHVPNLLQHILSWDWVSIAKFQSATTPSRPSLSETLFLNFTLHRKISQPPAISPRTVCEICELRRKSRLWDLGTAEPASFPPAVSFLVPNSHLTQLRRSPATDSPCADSPSNSIPSTE